MTGLGTILNTACILAGGLTGLFIFRNISAATQRSLRSLLALVSLVIGFMMIWDGISGSFPLKLHWSEPASGGAGFQVGDVLEPVGGKAARSARLRVTTITEEGAITALEIVEPGDYSNEPQPPIALAYPKRFNRLGAGRNGQSGLQRNFAWLAVSRIFVCADVAVPRYRQMGRD